MLVVHTRTHVERKRARWILVSQRRRDASAQWNGERGQGAEKDGDMQRERERERELRARDGSFIIAFSCVVCATVSCSLITMIHSRPRLPLSQHYVCHSVFVAMINLCTNPPLPEGRERRGGGEGGHNAYESANIITRDGESIGKHTPGRPPGESGTTSIRGQVFFFSGR